MAGIRLRLRDGAGTAEDLAWARQRLRALEDMAAEIGLSDDEGREIDWLARLLREAGQVEGGKCQA